MIIFYNIGISIYVFMIRCAALFNDKAALWVNGRKKWRLSLAEKTAGWKNSAWFHCASLGEFEMVRPFIEKIKKENQDQKIILTFFSPSGYEIRKDYPYADIVMYLPVDKHKNAEYFIETIKPVLAVFAKYDFWHHYLTELNRRNIKTYAVSSVFRINHRFFKWYGGIFRRDLKCFTKIFVQDEKSFSLLKTINTDSVIAGDTRFDRVVELSRNALPNEMIEKFTEDKKILIAGSSWQPEEKLIADVWKSLSEKIKVIIVPHDISDSHINEIEKLFRNDAVRFSNADIDSVQNYSVLIIDNIGMLGTMYQYSDVAIIGGGFTGKLHNILEAAVYGNVVMFGPMHDRFHEAQNMIEAQGAFEFSQEDDLKTTLNQLFSNDEFLQACRNNAQAFVKENAGAVNKIYPVLAEALA